MFTYLGAETLAQLSAYCAEYRLGPFRLVADARTYAALGQKVELVPRQLSHFWACSGCARGERLCSTPATPSNSSFSLGHHVHPITRDTGQQPGKVRPIRLLSRDIAHISFDRFWLGRH